MTNYSLGTKPDLALTCLPTARSVAVLILARNEAAHIGSTVLSVRRSLDPRDAIFVIADNCQDDTAELASMAGAFVLERVNELPYSKGAALKWFVDQGGSMLDSFDLFVILDADNQVTPEFLESIRAGYREGTVMQCLVQPTGYQGSTLAALIALSEIHEQATINRIRSRFGWPVRLRGTGMVIPTAQLKGITDLITTEVEDVALSLLFATRGIPIWQLDQVCVYDPKPCESIQASRQRARWFRGQWGALWHYRREALTLLLRGPAGWSMMDCLFLKPRWLVGLLMLLLAGAAVTFSWLLAGLILVRVVFELGCLVYTLLKTDERGLFINAILRIPAFIKMWLHGILLAFQKSTWLRARP